MYEKLMKAWVWKQSYDKNIKNQSIFISSTTLVKAQLSSIKNEQAVNPTKAFFTGLHPLLHIPIAYFVVEFIWNN